MIYSWLKCLPGVLSCKKWSDQQIPNSGWAIDPTFSLFFLSDRRNGTGNFPLFFFHRLCDEWNNREKPSLHTRVKMLKAHPWKMHPTKTLHLWLPLPSTTRGTLWSAIWSMSIGFVTSLWNWGCKNLGTYIPASCCTMSHQKNIDRVG